MSSGSGLDGSQLESSAQGRDRTTDRCIFKTFGLLQPHSPRVKPLPRHPNRTRFRALTSRVSYAALRPSPG
jgi:hypothetical protein